MVHKVNVDKSVGREPDVGPVGPEAPSDIFAQRRKRLPGQ
jgi:hypothetical protein